MTEFILILSCRMILGLPNDALYCTEFYLGVPYNWVILQCIIN